MPQNDPPMVWPRDYRGYRYACKTHQWASNLVPCPHGDGGPGPSAETGQETGES